jgi:hypothetical protein
MANTASKLFVAGLMAVLPASAGNGNHGQAAQANAPEVVVGAAEPERRLIVAFHNYAGVSRETLERAESEATRIFDKAGVKVEWLERAVSPEAAGPSVDELFPGVPVCFLRLLPDSMLNKFQRPAGELGFATGTSIYVFVGRAQRLSVVVTAGIPTVLGHIMAHEIGHVLLGENSHAPGTIMTSQLCEEQRQRAAWVRLEFSKAQAEKMQRHVPIASIGN